MGSGAVDELAAVQSWPAEARVEHQMSHSGLEEGLAEHSSTWGFDCLKTRCQPQEPVEAAVAVARVSLARGALPGEVVVPKMDYDGE